MENFSRRGTAGTGVFRGRNGILVLKLTRDAVNLLLAAL